MKDLSLLTWSEIRQTDKRRSMVFVVLAPIEEHGTHLPLATDLIEGEYWSRGAMMKLEQSLGIECFYLPSFPVAAASVNEFYGSVHFTMKTTCDVTFAILESLRCMGFINIVVIASHADPQHQIAVEKAVRKVNKRHGLCAIAPMGQIFMGVSAEKSEQVGKMEREHGNDFHAGRIETSSLMDIDPAYVREVFGRLPDTHITDRDMVFRKRQLAAMGRYGYIGAPRFASPELGRDLNEECIASICEAAEKFFRRDGYGKYAHYRLYDIIPLHIGFFRFAGKVRRRRVTE